MVHTYEAFLLLANDAILYSSPTELSLSDVPNPWQQHNAVHLMCLDFCETDAIILSDLIQWAHFVKVDTRKIVNFW